MIFTTPENAIWEEEKVQEGKVNGSHTYLSDIVFLRMAILDSEALSHRH
jgi:hypothetical protein